MRRRSLLVLLLLLFVLAASGWTWPVQGPVLQTFSFDQAHPYGAGQHRGIAIGAGDGAPVLAPASGVVTFAGTVPTNGKTLTIQTPSGLAVSLTHLGSIDVARNASVDEGATVGTVGPSGTPEFDVPYVHLGIRDAANDQGYLDPLAFLPVLAPPTAAPAPASPVDVAASAPVIAAPQPVDAPAIPVAPPAPVVEAPAVPVAPNAPVVDAPAPQLVLAAPAVETPAAALNVVDQLPAMVVTPAPVHEMPVQAPASGYTRPLTELPGAGAVRIHVPAPRATPAGPGVRPALADGSFPIWSPAIGATGNSGLRSAAATRPVRRPVISPAHGLRVLPIVLLALAAGLATLVAVRMISSPSVRNEGARPGREDSRRAGLAVRQWPAPHWSRGRIRRARGRLREVSPLEGRRRPHGERDGRARHAGDGVRRQDWGVAA
jgi:hypothetical protein